jgi:hypothetical protein
MWILPIRSEFNCCEDAETGFMLSLNGIPLNVNKNPRGTTADHYSV